MSATWDEKLQEGSFGGVRFDFVSAKDEHANDLDEQNFPGRPGTRVVARGRRGKVIDVLAVFIEDDYPEQMESLIEQLDDGGVVKKLVHPVFGELNAACKRFVVTHDVEDARDSATVQITFVEDNDAEQSPTAVKGTTPARANEVRSLADEVLTALTTFQNSLDVQNSEIGLAVTGAANAASSIADSLEADFDTLSTLEIQATTNGGLAKCDAALVLLDDYETTEQYDLAAVVLEMSHALRDLAQDLIDQRPPLSIYTVVADTNLLALAHDLGADAEELLTLNSFPDPSLIPAGFKVKAYAE